MIHFPKKIDVRTSFQPIFKFKHWKKFKERGKKVFAYIYMHKLVKKTQFPITFFFS